MKLFCRLLNVTGLTALAACRQTIERKVDHLRLRVVLVQSLLVNIPVARLTE